MSSQSQDIFGIEPHQPSSGGGGGSPTGSASMDFIYDPTVAATDILRYKTLAELQVAVSAGVPGARVLFTQNVTLTSSWALPRGTTFYGPSDSLTKVIVTVNAGVVISNLRRISGNLEVSFFNTAPCLNWPADGAGPFVFMVTDGAVTLRNSITELAQIPNFQTGKYILDSSPSYAVTAPVGAIFRGMGTGSILVGDQSYCGQNGGLFNLDFIGLGTIIEQNGADAKVGIAYTGFSGSIQRIYNASAPNIKYEALSTANWPTTLTPFVQSALDEVSQVLCAPSHALYVDHDADPDYPERGTKSYPFRSFNGAMNYIGSQPAGTRWIVFGYDDPITSPPELFNIPAGYDVVMQGCLFSDDIIVNPDTVEFKDCRWLELNKKIQFSVASGNVMMDDVSTSSFFKSLGVIINGFISRDINLEETGLEFLTAPTLDGQLYSYVGNNIATLSDATGLVFCRAFAGVYHNRDGAIQGTHGRVYPIRLEPNLVVNPQDPLYISKLVPGLATNVKPVTTGDIIKMVGYVRDQSTYDPFDPSGSIVLGKLNPQPLAIVP